jgi:hypothetical protein
MAVAASFDGKGKSQKLTADVTLHYAWKSAGRERTLTIQSLAVKASAGDVPLMDAFMSRTKMVVVENGKTEDVPFEKLPPAVQTKLQDYFGGPVYQLQVDEHGRAVQRTFVGNAGSRELLDNGLIATAVTLHPPFLADKAEWQADGEFSLGSDNVVRGPLTYKKAGAAQGLDTVKVSGTLTRPRARRSGEALAFKDARYVISGEQTYDPKLREWVAGKLTLDYSVQSVEAGQEGTTKGTMTITLERQPAK